MDRVRVGVSRSAGVTEVPFHMHDAAVTLARLEAFCRVLGRSSGAEILPVQIRDNEHLMVALESCELELAWLSPIVAFKASERGVAAPFLAPVRAGSALFHAALFTLDSAPLRGVDDLGAARVAWVDRSSAAGYAVVRAALRARGLDPDRLFASQTFEGSHQAVVQAVSEGTADVGATYLHRDAAGRLIHAGWGSARMRPVFEHGPIPQDVLAAGAHVDPALVERLAQALLSTTDAELGARGRELFESERFIRAGATHLALLARLADYLDVGRASPA